MPRTAITNTLIAKWNNAEDLTRYIIQYWMALAYPVTSGKKRRNSIILYLTAFFLCACYFVKELFIAGLFMFAAGYVLYQMSLRVDRPRLVHRKFACCALRNGLSQLIPLIPPALIVMPPLLLPGAICAIERSSMKDAST